MEDQILKENNLTEEEVAKLKELHKLRDLQVDSWTKYLDINHCEVCSSAYDINEIGKQALGEYLIGFRLTENSDKAHKNFIMFANAVKRREEEYGRKLGNTVHHIIDSASLGNALIYLFISY